MKKLLPLGLLALALVLACERPAHAWMNAKFSVGLNWSIQSGNNNWLWGVYRNGQVPGDYGPGPGGYPGPGPGYPGPGYPPGAPPYPQQPFPWFGSMPPGSGPTPGPGADAPPAPTANQHSTQQTNLGTIPSWYNANPYQAVSYQHGYNPGYNYNYPSYNYPSYNYASYGYAGYNSPNYYGNNDVPFYWYGNR